MYKKGVYKIINNEKIARDVFKMMLSGDTTYIKRAGQFINIKIPDKYLRRPISVCDYDAKTITIIYKVQGEGTKELANKKAGESLDILTGLGNGFETNVPSKQPLIIGGGVGVPPLYNLAKKLIERGMKVSVVLGFNSKEDVFFVQEFSDLGCEVFLSTVDGTAGIRGFVTDAISKNNVQYDYYFTCGPKPMLKAVHGLCHADGQLSFEERMGCGFGACMGCSCKTTDGSKRICVEGPVLLSSEVIW